MALTSSELGSQFSPVKSRGSPWLYLDCLEALLELFSFSGLMFTDSNYANIVRKFLTFPTVNLCGDPNIRGVNKYYTAG